MTREIKFRIIYKNKEELVAHGNKPSYWTPEKPSASLDYVLTNTKDYFVSQYTGLKDKNEKEIYEGDIVRQTTELKDTVSINNYGAKWVQETGIVTWDDEGADYNIVAPNGQFLSAFGLNNTTIEVIGDIYSNPDLLANHTEY